MFKKIIFAASSVALVAGTVYWGFEKEFLFAIIGVIMSFFAIKETYQLFAGKEEKLDPSIKEIPSPQVIKQYRKENPGTSIIGAINAIGKRD